jgi:histidine triad (HIT) family protein
MDDCIFCKIANHVIESDYLYEDDYVVAFRDLNPVAPTHVLVVPKTHVCCADKIDAQNSTYVAKIFEAIPKIAKEMGLTNGYRIINNCGEDGCQTVKHLHFHILGGKKLPENMG